MSQQAFRMNHNKTWKLGFVGPSGSGKDFVADAISARVMSAESIRFAEPLYKCLHSVRQILWNKSVIENQQPHDEWSRKFMQWIGTDWARQQDLDVFVRQAESLITTLLSQKETPGLITVPDVRFPNEAGMLRKHGFKLVYVNRAPKDKDAPWRSHESETSLLASDCDFVFHNQIPSNMHELLACCEIWFSDEPQMCQNETSS